jgi:hypothetical protein
MAAVTDGTALTAVVMLTPAAEEDLILTHRLAALMATHGRPFLKLHIGRVLVVRLQHAPDEHEEVAQPALTQCIADGNDGITGAERFAINVGMGHAVVGVGGVGFDRFNEVAGR